MNQIAPNFSIAMQGARRKIGRMTDAMSIAASGLQRYANDFLSSATRIVAAGGNFSEQDIVGLTEARIGFEASAVAFSDAAKMQDTLLDILV